MNYLAHLYLSQPTVESRVGNLLGDFAKGVKMESLPLPIQQGLLNHRLVDRFTDQHPDVMQLKTLISKRRRRFAGIMFDLLFDHLLTKHWQRFSDQELEVAIKDYYADLCVGQSMMPEQMWNTVSRVIDNDWLESYRSFERTGYALDRISNRIRFANDFAGSIEELDLHFKEIEAVFLDFFPALIAEVQRCGLEKGLR